MDPDPPTHLIPLHASISCKLFSWNVAEGERVRKGTVLCGYTQELGDDSDPMEGKLHLKSSVVGVVKELLVQAGEVVPPGAPVVLLEERCDHSIVVFDMCADCGLNLRKHPNTCGVLSQPVAASVSMIHGIPEIRISQKEANMLGHKDKLRLLQSRKLALVVDLDQTLVHTSVDPHIMPGLPDVYGFNLPGHPMTYHCRLRPHTRAFLQKVAKLYELHVFTMGTKSYAASVTHILDPEKKLFCNRIISRDEFFDPHSKALRLKSVFPCGDAMVAIVDDREDVWGRCPNLVHVKPYIFFAGTADINAPPPPPTPTTPGGSHFFRPKFPPQHVPFKTRLLSKGANEKELPRTSPPQVEVRKQSDKNFNMPEHPDPTALVKDEVAHLEASEKSSMVHVGNKNENATSTGGEGRRNGEEERGVGEEGGRGQGGGGKGGEGEEGKGGGVRERGGKEGDGEKKGGGGEERGREDEGGGRGGVGGGEGERGGIGGGEQGRGNEEHSVGSRRGEGGEGAGGVGREQEEGQGEGRIREERGGREGEEQRGKKIVNDKANDSSSSSSSSDSDSEDSSSSSSSEIDDSLFEHLGEEEQEGKMKEDIGEKILHLEMVATKPDTGEEKMEVSESAGQEAAQQESTEPRNKAEEGVEVANAAKRSEQTQKSRTLQIHDPDDFLIHLRDILTRIHTEFYTRYDQIKKAVDTSFTTDIPTPDLKEIIPKMRQSILKGANILFTGVIPTNMPPERSREWNTARAFGAMVHDQLIPGLNSSDLKQVLRATTHVVAAKVGTSKLREAKRTPGMKIVNPRWLWSCAEQWKWVDERLFPVEFVKGSGEESKSDLCDTQVKRMKRDEPLKLQLKRPTPHKEGKQISPTKEDSVCKGNDMLHEETQVQPTNPMSGAATTRHLSTESRLSVSDAELDKMEAEVDAELGSSSSDNENDAEQLGSFISKEEEEKESSYEHFTGEVFISEQQPGHSRKRKHCEVDESGSSNSPSSNNSLVNLDESVEQSEEESENDSGDELADLLG